MKNQVATIALTATLACLTNNATAADAGFYAGVGAGQMTTTVYIPPARTELLDDSTNHWRVFGGYRLGIVPILDFAAEVGYRQIGTATQNVNGVSAEYKTKGADASVLAIFPFLGADLFGRLGVMQYDLDRVVNGTRASFNGSAPLYGIGVGFRVWRLGVRLEYERLDMDEVKHIDGANLSVIYRF